MHPVTFRRVVNGYVIGVGCMEFVCEDFEKMINELREYHHHPRETEKKWSDYADKQGLPESVEMPAETACDPDRPRPDLPPVYRGESASPPPHSLGGGLITGRIER